MLQRPSSDKQKLVYAFQAMFNSIDMEVRVMEETKNELHQRAGDLQNSLWELADAQREEAEAERSAVLEDTYVTSASNMMVSYFIDILQQEACRYQATENVLRDYHYSRAAMQVPVDTPEPLNLIEMYVGEEFAGTPYELEEEEESTLTDDDKEALGQLKAAIDKSKEILCVSPPEPEPEAETDADGDAAVPGLLKGLKVEENLFGARTAALLRRARELLEDMRRREGQLHARMDALLGARFRAEMEGIKALVKEIKTRVESGERLLHELKLQVSDFVMDEDSLTYALVPKPPPLEPREQLPPFFLNTVQLAKMVAWLQSAAPGGQVLLEVLVAVFHRAAALAGLKLLPAEWIPLPPSKLRALLVSYQTGDRPGFVPCVDWRRVMYSLANLPEPTVGQLQKLVAAVKSLGPQIESLEAGNA